MTPEPATTRPQGDPFDALWRASSAPLTSVVLILLLALTLASAAIFPQIPPGLEATARERWLAATAAGYGNSGLLMRSAGLFNILGGAWLRVLLAVIAYHLVIRSGIHGGHLWQAYRRRQEPVAGRASWRPAAASFLVVFGPLLILLALLLNAWSGWRATGITLAPGSTALLPGSGGWQINLQQISGPDSNAIAAFTVTHPQGQARSGTVGYARPFWWGNMWVAQQATGSALAVNGQNSAGRPLGLRSQTGGSEVRESVYLLFTQAETEQAFEAPDQNLAFRAVSYPALPDRGIAGPVFLVEAYRGDNPSEPVLDQLVENEARMDIDGATYILRRDRHTVLDTSYLPGLLPCGVGGLLMLAGAILYAIPSRSRSVSEEQHGAG